MRRTSICGALETLLIDEKELLNHMAKEINQRANKEGCEVRADNKINKLFNNQLTLAKEIDWRTEYLRR